MILDKKIIIALLFVITLSVVVLNTEYIWFKLYKERELRGNDLYGELLDFIPDKLDVGNTRFVSENRSAVSIINDVYLPLDMETLKSKEHELGVNLMFTQDGYNIFVNLPIPCDNASTNYLAVLRKEAPGGDLRTWNRDDFVCPQNISIKNSNYENRKVLEKIKSKCDLVQNNRIRESYIYSEGDMYFLVYTAEGKDGLFGRCLYKKSTLPVCASMWIMTNDAHLSDKELINYMVQFFIYEIRTENKGVKKGVIAPR